MGLVDGTDDGPSSQISTSSRTAAPPFGNFDLQQQRSTKLLYITHDVFNCSNNITICTIWGRDLANEKANL